MRTPVATLMLALLATPLAHAGSNPIAQAVGDATRAESERSRDAVRHPADTLAFAGVKPGDAVLELLPGRGYYTHLFCRVVGAKGHVTTLEFPRRPPEGRPAGPPPGDMPAGAPPAAGAPGAPPAGGMPPMPAPEAPDAACAGVTGLESPMNEAKLPTGLDVVWTSENYHDLNNTRSSQADLAAFNRKVFAALKPGGVYIIEDHAAAPGTTLAQGDPLHRIDPAIVRQQLEAAGFRFDGESKVLYNPQDDHTQNPFRLEGRSDKFLYRFRKPAK